MKTQKPIFTILALTLLAPFGGRAEEGGGQQAPSISAREAREKSRLKSGGELVRDKVEIFTKPDGQQFTYEEVSEILESSGKEYGVTWKEDIAPAAGEAIDDLAAALGTTRKELEAVAKEAAASGGDSLKDAEYAIEQAKKELGAAKDDARFALEAAGKELKNIAGDTSYALESGKKEIKKAADDAEYALEAGKKELKAAQEDISYAVKESRKDLDLVAGDLRQAARQTGEDIKYALEVSGQGQGAVGMIASALGCTTDELVDVVQYFGKEAKTIFKEIAGMPELREMGGAAAGLAKDAEKIWVSGDGTFVAALGGGGNKVIIGQAPGKTAGKRVHRSVSVETQGAGASGDDEATKESSPQ